MDTKGSNYPHGRPHGDEHNRTGKRMTNYNTPDPVKAGVVDGLSHTKALGANAENEQQQTKGCDPRPARRGGESAGSKGGMKFKFG